MGIPAVDPPEDHQEAKEVLAVAYEGVFGEEPNLFALGIAQAIGLQEGKYGNWEAKNNWGAITRNPNTDGTCPSDAVRHKDSGPEGEYQTCFRVYPTSLDGAEAFLKELYVKRPDVYEYALVGDIRGVAQAMYSSKYYLGTAPATQKDSNGDFTNVNRYIDFIGLGVDEIAYLYPSGEPEKESSNTAMYIGAAVVAAGLIGIFASKS